MRGGNLRPVHRNRLLALAESLAGHLTPLVVAGHEVVEITFQREEGDQRVVDERFEDGRGNDPDIFVTPPVERAQIIVVGDDHQREELAEKVDGQENHPHRVPVDGSGEGQKQEQDESRGLYDRGQKLEDDHVGQRDEPRLAVGLVEDHLAVDHQRLEQPATPARTLAVEHHEVRRPLGPAAGLGDLHDLVGAREVAHVTHHAGQQVHVLGERHRVVTACRDGDLTVEKPESARDVGHGVDRRPPHLAHQVGAHVLQILEQRDRRMGRPHLDHLPVLDLAAVGHAHRAAHGDHVLRRREHGPDTAVEGVAAQDAVHVGADEVGILRGVDAGIRGVGLRAAVLLVDDDQPAVLGIRRLEHAPERLGLDALDVGERNLDQLVVFDQLVERGVPAAVVDDDHLEQRVVQSEHRIDVVDDGLLLVVGRGDHRHAGRIGRFAQHLAHVVVVVVAPAEFERDERQEHHDDKADRQETRIEKYEIIEKIEENRFHARFVSGFLTWAKSCEA